MWACFIKKKKNTKKKKKKEEEKKEEHNSDFGQMHSLVVNTNIIPNKRKQNTYKTKTQMKHWMETTKHKPRNTKMKQTQTAYMYLTLCFSCTFPTWPPPTLSLTAHTFLACLSRHIQIWAQVWGLSRYLYVPAETKITSPYLTHGYYFLRPP